MNETDLIERITETEQRSKSNTRRIDKLEQDTSILSEMASSIKLIAYKQDESNEKIDAIDGKVSALEKAPGENLSRVLWYIVGALCSAGVGALITYLFS